MKGEIEPGKPGLVQLRFQITSVVRPLWSVNKILDWQTDPDSEVMLKKREVFLRHSSGSILVKAKRWGGVYVSSMPCKLNAPCSVLRACCAVLSTLCSVLCTRCSFLISSAELSSVRRSSAQIRSVQDDDTFIT